MTAAAQPADGAVAFSASQCAVLRQMRVDTQGQCPARSTPPMRSLQADEASYNPSLGGTGAGGVGGRPAGGAGYAGDSAGGAAGAAPGAGVPGAPDEPEKPGSGGDGRPGNGGSGRPGSGRPPNPPGIIVVKPGGGTVVIKPGGIFDGKIDSKEEKRRALALWRRREGSDFNPPDPPKGNNGKHLGQARQGRNSK